MRRLLLHIPTIVQHKTGNIIPEIRNAARSMQICRPLSFVHQSFSCCASNPSHGHARHLSVQSNLVNGNAIHLSLLLNLLVLLVLLRLLVAGW